MNKTAMAACFAATLLAAQCAMAAGPARHNSRIVERASQAAQSVEQRIDGLSDAETGRLDDITSGAAARAVIALKCENAQFESVSRQVQIALDTRVAQVSSYQDAAKAYARDAASMKYKAMAIANRDVPCEELSRLREIAATQGFAN